jgi:hypothetical protein
MQKRTYIIKRTKADQELGSHRSSHAHLDGVQKVSLDSKDLLQQVVDLTSISVIRVSQIVNRAAVSFEATRSEKA